MNKFYKFTAQADTETAARLDLFGEVGGGFWSAGFDESTFKYEMDRAVNPEQALDIYINSPGGSVFTAIAIYELIKRHKGAVTIHVAGMAASAATIITSAPNAKVVMPTGSMLLVHPVRVALESSTAEELLEAATNLEKVRESVIDIYAKKTGLERDVLLELMQKESYLTASEAVELGFADELDESAKVENKITRGAYMIGGLKVEASLLAKAPKAFLEAENLFQETAVNEEETEVKLMDLETLKTEHPDLVQALIEELSKDYIVKGAEQERARILAIEEIATDGHAELVENAKRDATMTAEKLAVEILKAEKMRNASMLAARAADAMELADVVPVANEGVNPAESKAEAEITKHQQNVAHLTNLLKRGE